MGAAFSGQGKVRSAPSNQPGLGDLPESCLALILSFLGPSDICALAVLSKRFHQASLADTVWESKLPENYKILMKKLFADDHQASQTSILAKKDIYARLCCPTRYGGADTMEVWMEKNRGGICVAISWKGLKITGITDRRYWNHISTDESKLVHDLKRLAFRLSCWRNGPIWNDHT